ncbi:MAG TPA: hypothetical protein PLA68_12500 [Panacibacter sp.]|nr:hypothetical protein [Panacibacter sp.]
MKKSVNTLLFVFCAYLFDACNTVTPENYFDRAVLNVNMMQGFAGGGLQRELESPGVKMVEGSKDQFMPMKRKEIIDDKIHSIETNAEKVRQLKQTDDTKEMLQASMALYDFTLPVYKNEYMQLARLYDDGASAEQIQMAEKSIEEKYSVKFGQLFDALTTAGKLYAVKNNIQVNWNVQTSPQ